MARIGYDFQQFYTEKNKMRVPDGVHCTIPNCQNFLTKQQRKYCSQKCYSNWYDSLNIRSWEATRNAAIKRDGKCMDCGVTSFKFDIDKNRNCFEVHHIVSIVDGGDEFDIENCITLCSDCHIKRHSEKSNRVNMKISKNVSLDTFS